MAEHERWHQEYDRSPRRDVPFETMSGCPLEPVYGPPGAELPGQFPYTRGPYASMYRSRLWTMRQFAGFGTATDTNRRFKELLRAGGDGLSTAFDMPTLLGRDSDDPLAKGEVGRAGVAVDTQVERCVRGCLPGQEREKPGSVGPAVGSRHLDPGFPRRGRQGAHYRQARIH